MADYLISLYYFIPVFILYLFALVAQPYSPGKFFTQKA